MNDRFVKAGFELFQNVVILLNWARIHLELVSFSVWMYPCTLNQSPQPSRLVNGKTLVPVGRFIRVLQTPRKEFALKIFRLSAPLEILTEGTSVRAKFTSLIVNAELV